MVGSISALSPVANYYAANQNNIEGINNLNRGTASRNANAVQQAPDDSSTPNTPLIAEAQGDQGGSRQGLGSSLGLDPFSGLGFPGLSQSFGNSSGSGGFNFGDFNSIIDQVLNNGSPAAAGTQGSDTVNQADTGEISNPLAGFLDQINQGTGNEAGLGSSLEASLSYARFSFEFSSSTVSAVNSANGSQVQASSFNFSFSFESFQASLGGGAQDALGGIGDFGSLFDQLNSILGINPAEAGEDAGDSGETGETEVAQTNPTLSPVQEKLQEVMDAVQSYFGPEATANRILDFALSGFGNSSFARQGGDTQDSRSQFADFIGGAIQQGFDEALAILGDGMPQEVYDSVDQTYDLVFSGLDDFATDGQDEEADGSDTPAPQTSSNANQFASLEAYQYQASFSFSSFSYENQRDSSNGSDVINSPIPETSVADGTGNAQNESPSDALDTVA